MRVGRDDYWALVTRAARGDGSARTELHQSDVLDVLKWTNGIPGAGPLLLHFQDLPRSFSELAQAAVDEDITDVQRIGHVPSAAPGPTYELSEEQYWDGVRDVVRYARQGDDALQGSADQNDRALADALYDLLGGDQGARGGRGSGHPFLLWPRCLDVLRHTASQGEIEDPDLHNEAKDTAAEDWTARERRGAIVTIAGIAMFADAWRLAHAVGNYIPNIRQQSYWDEIRKLERSLPYPLDVNRDVVRVTFFNDFHDALDVLRLSSNPAMLSYRVRDLVPGQQGWIPPAQRYGGPPPQLITVESVVLVAARYAALADVDYLGSRRQPFTSTAPAPITLDQYRDYVTNAANHLSRNPDPSDFEALFFADATGGYGGHPLLAWNPSVSDFPYRALDVLMHTDRPEALWDDEQRRRRFVQAAGGVFYNNQDQMQGYLNALSRDSVEQVINWIASAAFCADVLDELGAMQLGLLGPAPGGRFTPNIRPSQYWDAVRDITPRTHYPIDYDKDIHLTFGFVADFHDAIDVLRLTSSPTRADAWIGGVGVAGGNRWRQGLTDVGGRLSVPDSMLFTVAEYVIGCARLSALEDTDYWARMKAPFPKPGSHSTMDRPPPPLSLDEYLALVHQAAVTAARAMLPEAKLEELFNMNNQKSHPLLHWQGVFPWRALDVLEHTARPEAIYDDPRRGSLPHAGYDPWIERFDKNTKDGDVARTLVVLASAAMLADVMDELGALRLSKYAPNPPIRVSDERDWLWHAVDDWLAYPREVPPWLYPLARDAGVSQADLFAYASEHPTTVDVRQYLTDQVENAADAQVQGYLGRGT